jgi:hypothetical protein
MTSHILITGSATQHQGQLRGNIDALQRWFDDAQRLKAVMDKAASGEDWEALGTLLGLKADQAQYVYNLLSAVVAEVNKTAIIQYLAELG